MKIFRLLGRVYSKDLPKVYSKDFFNNSVNCSKDLLNNSVNCSKDLLHNSVNCSKEKGIMQQDLKQESTLKMNQKSSLENPKERETNSKERETNSKETNSKGTKPTEIGGPKGKEPTRFGDWERNGRCYDF
jgi:hypothetical protein